MRQKGFLFEAYQAPKSYDAGSKYRTALRKKCFFSSSKILRQKGFLFEAYPVPKSYVITLEQNIESDQDGKIRFLFENVYIYTIFLADQN